MPKNYLSNVDREYSDFIKSQLDRMERETTEGIAESQAVRGVAGTPAGEAGIQEGLQPIREAKIAVPLELSREQYKHRLGVEEQKRIEEEARDVRALGRGHEVEMTERTIRAQKESQERAIEAAAEAAELQREWEEEMAEEEEGGLMGAIYGALGIGAGKVAGTLTGGAANWLSNTIGLDQYDPFEKLLQALKADETLTVPDGKIIDFGAGVGKTGARYSPKMSTENNGGFWTVKRGGE